MGNISYVVRALEPLSDDDEKAEVVSYPKDDDKETNHVTRFGTTAKSVDDAIDDLEEVAEEHDLDEAGWESVDDASDYLFEHKVKKEEKWWRQLKMSGAVTTGSSGALFNTRFGDKKKEEDEEDDLD